MQYKKKIIKIFSRQVDELTSRQVDKLLDNENLKH